MTHVLHHVLKSEDLARINAELENIAWRPGRQTAGGSAPAIKHNLQADTEDKRTQALERVVIEALHRHPVFEAAARPARATRVLFSRYEPGMAYGPHIDDPMMGGLRTDLAFTLFLSGDYEGGALSINDAAGEREFKLEPGDAILYSAGTIHRVAPVTSGVRRAAVGWVQSLIGDPTHREALFDLSTARAHLARNGAKAEDLLGLDKAIANLMRLWARP